MSFLSTYHPSLVQWFTQGQREIEQLMGPKNMGMGYGDHMEERKSAKNTIIEIIIIIINMYLQVTIIKIIIIIII